MKEGNSMEYKKSQSLSEQVADEILDMIVVKKQFKMGDKLPNETRIISAFKCQQNDFERL